MTAPDAAFCSGTATHPPLGTVCEYSQQQCTKSCHGTAPAAATARRARARDTPPCTVTPFVIVQAAARCDSLLRHTVRTSALTTYSAVPIQSAPSPALHPTPHSTRACETRSGDSQRTQMQSPKQGHRRSPQPPPVLVKHRDGEGRRQLRQYKVEHVVGPRRRCA